MTQIQYVELQSVTIPINRGQISFDVLIEGETAKVRDRITCLLEVEPGSWLLCSARDTQLGLEIDGPGLGNSGLRERIEKAVRDGFSGLRKVINAGVLEPDVRPAFGDTQHDRIHEVLSGDPFGA